ncbi:MAG TPA: hypothetical protein VG942_06535 [Hyphomonadaceae bacterium]|nr:hypothetical protein [Hyphomonadaceae bacterium]
MKLGMWASCAIAALALAACGGSNSGGASGGGGSANASGGAKAAPTGNATAEQVAKEQRGNVNCPAKIATPARAANAPVDDVVGVRPGLTYEEAVNVVLCDNPMLVTSDATGRGFQINTYGQKVRQGFDARFAEARVEKTSQQIMKEMQDDMMARSGNAIREDMKPGQIKYYVGTMGMPGQEKVITAAREEWYPEGKLPPATSVADALIKKYGTPTHRQDIPGTQIYLRWAYDPLGRLITETSPKFNSCTGVDSPDGGANVSPDCGIVVQARVQVSRENQDLAKLLQVGVVDQANGYGALKAVEDGLKAQDDARKAKELNDATKNATAPKL